MNYILHRVLRAGLVAPSGKSRKQVSGVLEVSGKVGPLSLFISSIPITTREAPSLIRFRAHSSAVLNTLAHENQCLAFIKSRGA